MPPETPPQIVDVSAAALRFAPVAVWDIENSQEAGEAVLPQTTLVVWVQAAGGRGGAHAPPAVLHCGAAGHPKQPAATCRLVRFFLTGASLGVEDARRASKEAVMRLGASRRDVGHPAQAVSLLVHYLSRRLPLPLNTKSIPRATALPALPLTAISRSLPSVVSFRGAILHPPSTATLHSFTHSISNHAFMPS